MAQLSPQVKKCVDILSGAKTDTEKFAGLFLVTKLIKGNECTSEVRKHLLEAIGVTFLKRLLMSNQVVEDCPASMYKSVALAVLSCFCADSDLVAHSDMLTCIPVFLEIVQQADTGDYDDMLIVISESYDCLSSFTLHPAGRAALIKAGAIDKLSEIYYDQGYESDKALNVLVQLVSRSNQSVWNKETVSSLHNLLNKVSLEFETDNTERKFELCDVLRQVLLSSPNLISHESSSEELWPWSVLKGLTDILTSKIGKSQRDPALKLASAAVQVLGVEWTLSDQEKSKKFLLLLIHLCCVEVRMQLEDKPFKEVLKNAELIMSCFILLELSVRYIATDTLELEEKEKQQLYVALKGALSAVITLLTKISSSYDKCTKEEKTFLSATIRVLAAWLAQETSAMRNYVYEVLPFVLLLANETFYSFRENYTAISNKKPGEEGASDQGPLNQVDLLRLLLPALCHLTVEDKARHILMDKNELEVLFECVTFHWSVVDYKKPVIPKAERLKALSNPAPPIPPHQLAQMSDSRAALVSLCNIFMNTTALEPKLVEESPVFANLLRFILDNVPQLKTSSENLVLLANMSVLGLLLLKQNSSKASKNDFTICRYMQSAIRFLWDAYNVDESRDSCSLVVSMSYKQYWLELMELWFLGMQTMSALIKLMPWISEFALESGWAQGIIDSLRKVRSHSLPSNTKAAYEDLLCSLVLVNNQVASTLKEHDALTACRNHRLMELGKNLFGD